MATPNNAENINNHKVSLNLDTLEREDPREPFSIVISGKRIVMSDPSDLDWKVLMDLNENNPMQFFRYVVAPDDQAHFKKADIPGWKMRKLMELYQEHYGLDNLGNAVGSRT